MDSEVIYEALFTEVKSLYNWVSAQRRLRHPDDLKSTNMPAIFQIQMTDEFKPDSEAIRYGNKGTNEDVLRVNLMIFTHSGPSGEWPSSIANPIIDSVKAAFSSRNVPPGLSPFNTLGGLVEYAVVSGTIEFYENALSSSLLTVIPIKILTFA